jgi:hypothetical protein
MATSAAERLKRAKKVSGKKESTSKKKELRVVVIDAEHHPQIRKVCTLGFLIDQVKSPMEQNKKAAQVIFFDMWTGEMFKDQKKPDNFRVLLPKLDDNGQPLTALDDVRCTFQLKFRAAGIAKKVPKEDDLPEGKTLQEVLMKFVAEEIEVEDNFDLAKSLNKMMATADDDPLHIVADKFLSYLQARTKSKDGMVKLPAITDEQEAAALVTEQTVSLKEGMLDRIFTYCKKVEQLRKLLTYCEVTLQVADFDFGMSDEPAAKADRIKSAIVEYLVGEDA